LSPCLSLSSTGRHRSPRRQALVLVVVLVIVSVLALLGASFSYYINAQLASVQALQDQQQARFAAETGIHRAVELLREGRWDMTNWYNNYQVFRRIPVYVPEGKTGEEGKGGSESVADQEKVKAGPPGASALWPMNAARIRPTGPRSVTASPTRPVSSI